MKQDARRGKDLHHIAWYPTDAVLLMATRSRDRTCAHGWPKLSAVDKEAGRVQQLLGTPSHEPLDAWGDIDVGCGGNPVVCGWWHMDMGAPWCAQFPLPPSCVQSPCVQFASEAVLAQANTSADDLRRVLAVSLAL